MKAVSGQKKAWAFEDLLIAAMKDAALERKLTQLKATITPHETGNTEHVRIVIIPEKLDVEWPEGVEHARGEQPKKPGGH